MYGECLSCEKKSFTRDDGQKREYYMLCIRFDGMIGFISSPESYEIGSDVPMSLYVDRNHRFAVSVDR